MQLLQILIKFRWTDRRSNLLIFSRLFWSTQALTVDYLFDWVLVLEDLYLHRYWCLLVSSRLVFNTNDLNNALYSPHFAKSPVNFARSIFGSFTLLMEFGKSVGLGSLFINWLQISQNFFMKVVRSFRIWSRSSGSATAVAIKVIDASEYSFLIFSILAISACTYNGRFIWRIRNIFVKCEIIVQWAAFLSQ